jgi:1-acyl-sn-glycerol-3-phosphate acyltransferase
MVNELAAEIHEIEIKVRNRAQQAEGDTAQVEAFVADILKLIAENLERMAPPQVRFVLDLLRKFDIDLEDYLSPDFWRGVGMLIGYQIKEQSAFIERRLQGDYAIDPYGMDLEIIDIVRPFLTFMYRTWWRTTTEGIAHVPASGRALLVANHSGVLPWDGAMLATAVYEEHPSARIVRNLFLHWFSTLPFVAPLLADLGQVSGSPENAINLLENDELVCVFPEGVKGIGKLFQQRYRLARFGRGGFVQAALRTGAPLVPVTIIGAEEIYPLIANAKPVARMFGMPYFPITPFFPWLGPLGAIPLPTHWNISFGPPISTQEYGPDAADDPLIVFMLTEQVRSCIQTTLDAKLQERTSTF